jgi:hypothetical protein
LMSAIVGGHFELILCLDRDQIGQHFP